MKKKTKKHNEVELEREIVKGFKEGRETSNMARELGVSYGYVSYRIDRYLKEKRQILKDEELRQIKEKREAIFEVKEGKFDHKTNMDVLYQPHKLSLEEIRIFLNLKSDVMNINKTEMKYDTV